MAVMPEVTLSPYDSGWPEVFCAVRSELLAVFADANVCIEHIGSTSVPGLSAKPVIDVLLGARSLTDIETRIPALAEAGYAYRPHYEQQIPDRRYFVKASPDALRIHLHAVEMGAPIWRAHLGFRDALRSCPTLSAEYEALKLQLAAEHAYDKTGYTEAKAPFITRVLRERAGIRR
jgi:GrpB-like predicted nucleotidyltransferase (UPF0157 family)